MANTIAGGRMPGGPGRKRRAARPTQLHRAVASPLRVDSGGGSGTDDGNNPWGKIVGEHPQPGSITAQGSKTHILYGDGEGQGGHSFDSGMPGKTVFPEDWGQQKIISEVQDVANHPNQIPVEQSNGNFVVSGTRDGVDIEVIVRPDGQIATAYPTGGQGVAVNDANGEPSPLQG